YKISPFRMKKLYSLSCLILLLISCQDNPLEDFKIQPGSASTIGSGNIAGIIEKTNENITVPISVRLSTPASKAFEISLVNNQPAALEHIKSNKLGNDYIAIKTEAISLPNSAKVNFGADSAIFSTVITRTEIEKYYGKKVVLGYTISNAGKSNNIDKDNATGIIILNTTELITPEDIHYISLTNGAGMILEAKNQVNYESTSSGLTFPIGVSLASFPGAAFSVEVSTSTDTIAELIQKKILPANTVALKPNEYTITNRVQIGSNEKSAGLELTVPWTVISENIDKKLAVVVELISSTLHVINPEKKYSILLIDAENVVEIDVTNDGEFSASRDNEGNENERSIKLIDGDYNSKFLLRSFTDVELSLIFDAPQKIGAYTFTSGGDDQRRDPNEWTIYGSNDGQDWKVVDSRANEEFPDRTQTRRFNIDIPEAYTHYRLHITGNVGSELFQLAEWRMIRIP